MNDVVCMVIDDSKSRIAKNVNTKCFGNSSTFKGSQNAFSVTYSKYVSVNSTTFEKRVSHISSL